MKRAPDASPFTQSTQAQVARRIPARRLLHLGSALVVASLTALASSCSDDEKTGETTYPPDATNELVPITPDTGGPAICPSTSFQYREDDVSRFLGGEFRAPTVTVGACTTTEIATFEKNVRTATSATPLDDLKKDISDPCSACLVSTTAATSWQLVVGIAGGAPTDYIVNFGACHSALSSATPQTCGRTVLYGSLCARAACRECDPSALEPCVQKVRAAGGACFDVHNAITQACPDYPTTQTKCGTSVAQHAQVLCGPVITADAGTDAETDAEVDAGDGG